MSDQNLRIRSIWKTYKECEASGILNIWSKVTYVATSKRWTEALVRIFFLFVSTTEYYPTVPSKSGYKSEATEKLLKNILLISGLTSSNSSPVSLAREFGSVFLTNCLWKQFWCGRLTDLCLGNTFPGHSSVYPNAISYWS